jgi:AraC-like DNA-binding protein
MGIAKTRLLDPKLKISDIAEKLGYKHATHFSAAYKKHFGELPRPRNTKKETLSKN